MFNLSKRAALVRRLPSFIVDGLQSRTLLSSSVLPPTIPSPKIRGEFPVGIFLPSTPRQWEAVSNIIQPARPKATGLMPASVGPEADLLGGNIYSDSAFDYESWTGPQVDLPDATPSSASINHTDPHGNDDGYSKGTVAFNTSSPSASVTGSVSLDVNAGDPDYGYTWASMHGQSNTHFDAGMRFSYFAQVQVNGVFSSSASGVTISGYDPYGSPTSKQSSGAAIPLAQPNGVDTISFHADAYDPAHSDYNVGVQSSGVFAVFQYYYPVTLPPAGDINGDGVVDQNDVQFQNMDDTAQDLDGDNDVDSADLDYMFTDILNTRNGDFNLDGKVNFSDFLILQNNFGMSGGFAQGDADGNLTVDFNDFTILQNNWGYGT